MSSENVSLPLTGYIVEATALQRAELNGLRGEVVGRHEARALVKLHADGPDGTARAFRPENLMVVGSSRWLSLSAALNVMAAIAGVAFVAFIAQGEREMAMLMWKLGLVQMFAYHLARLRLLGGTRLGLSFSGASELFRSRDGIFVSLLLAHTASGGETCGVPILVSVHAAIRLIPKSKAVRFVAAVAEVGAVVEAGWLMQEARIAHEERLEWDPHPGSAPWMIMGPYGVLVVSLVRFAISPVADTPDIFLRPLRKVVDSIMEQRWVPAPCREGYHIIMDRWFG
eukprot:Hpha_TRINITY_DN30879_c0_g1::TRINITY_DN30879_c0_g1_i1::g.155553::m.155553